MRFEKAFVPDGVVTYGSQTHPAHRHAGLITTGYAVGDTGAVLVLRVEG